jgi:hypothetical protein
MNVEGEGSIMNQLCRFAILGVSTAFLTATARADIVTDWNIKTLELTQAVQATGNAQARTLAMVHVAMSDAINSVKGRFTRYTSNVPMMPAASVEAAAASAARIILTELFANQKAGIDETYTLSIKAIPEGESKAQGIALGEKIAAAVLADRASDGTAVLDTYRPITAPGVWVPTTPPIQEQYARAKPWVLKSADQFRPGPPPNLTSAEYARDYNETKSLGGAKSVARTAEQTALVRFWPTPSLSLGWQSAARQLAVARELPLDECARLFALMNMASANSFITDWDAKFTYNFWRPVTAIRNGDQDGNDATERDASWTPLAPTPMHPEYPSQAAISAGVALGVIEAVFGPNPNVAVTIADPADPKRTRSLTVSQIAEEHNNVRIWGGIHFRNSLEVATDMGRKIAGYLVANVITPAR